MGATLSIDITYYNMSLRYYILATATCAMSPKILLTSYCPPSIVNDPIPSKIPGEKTEVVTKFIHNNGYIPGQIEDFERGGAGVKF